MPARETVEAFAALLQECKFLEAIDAYYLPDTYIQENNNEPIQGKAFLAEREGKILAASRAVRAERLGPSLIEGDTVVTKWRFDFEMKNGVKRRIEEVAWQQWDGEKIASERFYYDPAQTQPATAAG